MFIACKYYAFMETKFSLAVKALAGIDAMW